MLTTSSLSGLKKLNLEDYDYKYFIVLNPKNIKLKGFRHRPDLAPSSELYSWAMLNKTKENWFEEYERKFKEEMVNLKGTSNALRDIEIKSKSGNVLIVCFCEDPNLCHRKIEAEEMVKRNVEVIIN